MQNLDYKTYLDKVRACWLGKNIGGTLGAPFECKQGAIDLDFYTHDIAKGVLPNDDLDLQLVWLIAAEREGKNVNAEILANYWLTYIVPDWSEYGYGKRNLRAGILPSVSGGFENTFRESNGAWIRSEIWACLAPGRPDIAVRYAYEDAAVDHWGEGIWAEMFCAAIESAAFVEADMDKLIEIGMSYIPTDCALSKAIRLVQECAKDPAMDWKAARKKLLQAYPSSFGERPLPGGELDPELPAPVRGYDAPANVALAMLGHYFGKGDFSRAVCIAAGCCEDADCTAGTLAALYGIRGGTACIDQKWLDPIGDEIKTISLDLTKHGECKTVSELTARVARLMPTFMDECVTFDGEGKLEINVCSGGELYAPDYPKDTFCRTFHADKLCLHRETAMHKINALFDTAKVENDKLIEIELTVEPRYPVYNRADWLTLVWHMPPEWEAVGGRESTMTLHEHWRGEESYRTGIIPHELRKGRYFVTLEIRQENYPTRIFIPFTFMNTL
jgi:ADP-ribosylglycohydrolase